MSSIAFFCHNPHCQKTTAFANESALQKHLSMCLPCKQFLNPKHSSSRVHQCTTTIDAGVSLRNATAANGMLESHKKRKVVRRRDMINHIDPAFLQLPMHATGDIKTSNPNHPVNNTNDDEDNNSFANHANSWEEGCSEAIVPASVSLKDHHFIHSVDQKWTIELLKVLDNINAPDFAYGDILSWARDAKAGNFSFNPPGGLSRSKSIDILFNSMPNAHELLPTVVSIAPDASYIGPPVGNVVVFDFVRQ
jgi:hypothetical protein